MSPGNSGVRTVRAHNGIIGIAAVDHDKNNTYVQPLHCVDIAKDSIILVQWAIHTNHCMDRHVWLEMLMINALNEADLFP